MVDSRIGPYKFIREIAKDELGQVFEAIDLTSKKHFAIKALRPEAANLPQIVSRLYSEAKTFALLNHPNIARIFGFIRRTDQLYLVMELVEGKSVQAILKEKNRLGPTVALAFFHQALSAVRFAHELGVIHGNLRPSNIMVTNFGQIKVLDFAIATILGSSDSIVPVAGTVHYLSPEQIRREPVDVRSDLYSLGVLLYEFIVGQAPFNRDGDVAPGSLESTPLLPSLLVANCPRWLDAFVLRALAPSPEDRFQSIAAMAQALGSPVEAKTSAERRRAWLQRGTRWVTSRPTVVLSATDPMRRSLRGKVGAMAKITRQKRAGVASTLQHSVETLSPLVWTKSSAIKIKVWLYGMAAVLDRILGTTNRALTATLDHAIETTRQKNATVIRATRGRMETIHPLAWTKRGAAQLKDRVRSFQPEPISADRLFGSLKEKYAAFSEGGWQRYVAITIVLASILIETFIFGGTNTLLQPDYNPLPATTQNGAAQSLLNQLDPTPRVISAPDRGARPQPKTARRIKMEPKTSTKASGDAERYDAARSARRTVTYRADLYDSPGPGLQEAAAGQAIPPRRNLENNAVKKQLNVKWEN